jgi:hypothetical protein
MVWQWLRRAVLTALRERQRLLNWVCDQSIEPIRSGSSELIIPGRHGAVTKRWAVLLLSMIVGLALCIVQSHGVNGQGLNTNTNGIGVRHAIIAAVEADQDAAAAKQDVEARNATVDILVRVLDYALDYRFYGVVDGKFSDFDPGSGAKAQEIWADRKCHQYRGLPRIWVLAINGRIPRGETVFDIAARPRHVGELVPKDEVVTQKDRNVELDDPNQSVVTLARTTESRLSVKLTLTSTKCRLNAD